jgi:hypothetical protein
MIGLGTILNVAAILVGSALGVWFGHRLPERTTRTVTDALGLVVLVIGAQNVVALQDPAYVAAVGDGLTLLIVLAALLAGGIAGSLLRIEDRLESVGGWLQAKFVRGDASPSRARFVEGFVDASLVFCIGPLAILGSLMPPEAVAAITATGGVLLLGVGIRLMQIRAIPVGDLLPALAVAPLLTALVAAIR